MKNLFKNLSFVLILLMPFLINCMPTNLSKTLFDTYENYQEKKLTIRRFKHRDIQPIIEKLPFQKKIVGYSFENRAIHQISLGSGKTKVLLWSQMHGDEATATMAIMDIFKFFQAKNDGFDEFRQKILQENTLYFVPMLNPDGAERFQRRTATDIDMNRDALRFQTPEGQVLRDLQQQLSPEYSFNLHDQSTRYSAGNTAKQATISFLATSYNFEREWNEPRTRAMQVICGMNETLKQFIDGYIAKYSDEHEPRAFGDNIAKWGSGLILIESGGYKDDREKQFIRKLNFVAILTALHDISTKSYTKFQLKDYEAIPNNEKYLFDFLIRNATFDYNGKQVVKDVGINFNEKNTKNATDFTLESVIEDMGDLSTFWGIQELDATGLTLKPLKDVPTLNERLKATYKDLINNELNLGESASFVLMKDQNIKYLIINGQILE